MTRKDKFLMSEIVAQKRCSKCKTVKPSSQFYKQKTKKSGLASHCIECQKKWISANREKINARQRKYSAIWYHENKPNKPKKPLEQRRQSILKKYGLTVVEYDEMLRKQNGVCAICGGTNSDGKGLFIDHDHKTGRIRGLLCNDCNLGIGRLKDSVGILTKAIGYLTKFFGK
jgi:hypothetical protein